MSLNPKILITDAVGMIGVQLVKDLIAKGNFVRILKFENDNFDHLDSLKNNIEVFEANLFDVGLLEDAMQGIEQIYHCKELLSFHPQEEQKIMDVNIIGTRNIVNVALSLAVKKIVFLSSTLSFGTYHFNKTISEKTKWVEHKDNTNYSISKHYAELEIHRAQQEGLETIIVNPSFVLGKSLGKNTLYNFQNIADAQYRYSPKGSNGFVKIEDVAKASILLMESELVNEQFILSAENLKYQTVLEKLNPILKKKKLFSRTNSLKVNLIWRINKMKSVIFNSKPFLSEEIYGFDGKDFEIDGRKICDVLDFVYTKI